MKCERNPSTDSTRHACVNALRKGSVAIFLRKKIATEPFRSALTHAWRVESVEGFLSHFIARDSLARTLAHQQPDRNTDDQTLIEFGFARGLGAAERFNLDELASVARNRNEDRPTVVHGTVD